MNNTIKENAFMFKIWTAKHKLESSIQVFQMLYETELQRVKNEKTPILNAMNKLQSNSHAWNHEYIKLQNIVDNSSNFKIMLDSLKNTLSIIKSESKQIEEKYND